MGKYREVFHPLSNKSFNFYVKVKASCKRNSIGGVIYINGIWYLKLTIKEVAENGKANKVIIDFLSRKWSLPQKSITIIKGTTSNYKTINIKNENWDPYNIEIAH
jgi:uncharacterized protein YggU (UPF0235/DUF167 family)